MLRCPRCLAGRASSLADRGFRAHSRRVADASPKSLGRVLSLLCCLATCLAETPGLLSRGAPHDGDCAAGILESFTCLMAPPHFRALMGRIRVPFIGENCLLRDSVTLSGDTSRLCVDRDRRRLVRPRRSFPRGSAGRPRPWWTPGRPLFRGCRQAVLCSALCAVSISWDGRLL